MCHDCVFNVSLRIFLVFHMLILRQDLWSSFKQPNSLFALKFNVFPFSCNVVKGNIILKIHVKKNGKTVRMNLN